MNRLHTYLRTKYYLAKWRLLGRNVEVKSRLFIYGKVDIRGKGSVVFGDNCKILDTDGVGERYTTIYTYDAKAKVIIGNNVILSSVRVSAKYEVQVENNTVLEDSSILDTDFHSIDRERGEPDKESFDKCKVLIGEGTRVGARSIIGKGVRIGSNTTVAPGSIVLRSVPSNSFVIGNPARVIRTYDG